MKAASIVNEAYLRRASVTCEMSSCHILAAVAAWMSLPSQKASVILGSSLRWAMMRSSI